MQYLNIQELLEQPYEESLEERQERVYIEQFAKTVAGAPLELRSSWRDAALRVLQKRFGRH